ncbi:response regulator transcription factor [Lachnoclostridium phytofermentans]|uniref:Stage 0 sporulation protein A homolog n=1 Tax=Lachnoclostridium phytofermentans (strain ATCC 700394 / DSM 18823 / ISDg) TaxID=357809 RepID=A9KJ95_LACP7|nr:response regulator [Lachnoclostridium phytofermentans]ABX42507.1 two component transcriptional regulator, AraC family [Lachnoclostridium phytofermentans ISDg]
MLKVLIAEDEDIIRKGLAYTIDWLSIGYVLVGEAANGEEGLEKIRELKPDVVITDIMMPKLNGLELIRQASKEVRFKSVILTSYAEFDYAKEAIELKAYDYLMKPVDVDKLKEVMRKLQDDIKLENEKELLFQQKSQGMDIKLLSSSDSYKNPYVKKAIDIMKERYIEKLSIESISEELKVSSSYLSRKFKEDTGHTYLDFLNMYRVQQAIRLLDEGVYRVYQVSDMTGFTDYKHFCAVFKRYTKTSPTEFIKNKGYTGQ